MTGEQALVLVKLLHTAIWAVMASAVVGIPICAIRGRFRPAMWLSLLILVECLALALGADARSPTSRCDLPLIANPTLTFIFP